MISFAPSLRWPFRGLFFLGIFISLLMALSFDSNRVNVTNAMPVEQIDPELTGLMERAAQTGSIRVIVALNVPPEPIDESAGDDVYEQRIASAQNDLLAELPLSGIADVDQFEFIPFLAMRVDVEVLESLLSSEQVLGIEEDVPIPMTLSSSTAVIGANLAWNSGYSGVGQTVAILDTGVDLTHPAFTTGGNRIVAQGCYSTTDTGYGSQSVCPGGADQTTINGAGDDCVNAADGYASAQSDCSHGTHVAGIAAGNDGATFGVAKDANIIAVQIFSLFTNSGICGGSSSCMLTFTSDQIKGLERVYALRDSFDITAVNMSLGGNTPFNTACDSDSRKAVIDKLRQAGIATIIAAGNNGYKDAISKPACISSAISVGSTTDNDFISSFSNVGSLLDVLAPGSSIVSALPGNGYGSKSGTSMATPHVTGAWAVYKQAVPNATVDNVLDAFRSTAVLIDDSRAGGVEVNLPRIHIEQAISAYRPGLTINHQLSQAYTLPGQRLDFTITVVNNTTIPAPNVTVDTVIPSYLSVDPSSLSADVTITEVTNGSKLTWHSGQTLAPQATLVRTFSAIVSPYLPQTAVIASTATATSSSAFEPRQATATVIVNKTASCDYSQGFESGELGEEWAIEKTNNGRVSISSKLPSSGAYSLLLDDSTAGDTYSEAAAILNINLKDYTAVTLTFDWHDLADEYDPQYDGVFIRSNPTMPWVKIFDFDSSNNTEYQNTILDLYQLAEANGVTLSKTFQIKFGFYDNYPASFQNINGGDGYAIDNVSLSCVPAGLTLTQNVNDLSPDPGQLLTYSLVVANNEVNTIASTIISSTIPTELDFAGSVELHGGNGNVAQEDSDLPTLVSGMSIPGSGQVTILFPLYVKNNLKAGTVIELPVEVLRDGTDDRSADTQMVIVRNVLPEVTNDEAETERDTPIVISPLLNDSDNNGDVLRITAVSQPASGGTATTNGTTINYTPTAQFAGIELITYTVSDGMGGEAEGTIAITVPNVPPVAQDDVTAAPPGAAIYYPVLANDYDLNEQSLIVTAVTQPPNGTATVTDNQIHYVPSAGFEGTVQIPYHISDGHGGQATAELTISFFEGANGAPVAQPDFASINRDQAINLTVLANDIDPNGDAIVLLAVEDASFGTAVIQNNTILYTPKAGFIGTDSFSYTIRDANGALGIALVSIKVGLNHTEIFPLDPTATVTQYIVTSDQRLQLAIPPGALPSTAVELAYTTLDVANASLEAQQTHFYFALNLGDSNQTYLPNPTFSPPIELTLTYDPTTMPATVTGNDLTFYYFNTASQSWQTIQTVSRDAENQTLTIHLHHFTDFALVANHKIFLPIGISD